MAKTKKVNKKKTNKAAQKGLVYPMLGVALMIFGLLTAFSPVVTTLFTLTFLAWMLVIGGVVMFVAGLFQQVGDSRWSGVFFGMIAFLFGVAIMLMPLYSLADFTIFFGIVLFIDGLGKVIMSATNRTENWGWTFIAGLVMMAFSLMIFMKVVAATLVVLGTAVSVYLVLTGATMLMNYYASVKK